VPWYAELPRYRRGEEIASSVIHGVGAVLAITALGVLSVLAARDGTAWHVVGCSIFGVTLILLYTVSTLYHGIPQPRVKAALRVVDHCAIFLLIAGTYTPFALVNLRGPWGWSLLGVVWAAAACGVALRAALRRQLPALFLALYLTMGWAALAVPRPLLDHVEPGGVGLLLAGGLAYTVGVAFYLWRRLPYQHAIWHVFVLAGSTLHFFAILLYVIPAAGPAG
jgi:hemolysin III